MSPRKDREKSHIYAAVNAVLLRPLTFLTRRAFQALFQNRDLYFPEVLNNFHQRSLPTNNSSLVGLLMHFAGFKSQY